MDICLICNKCVIDTTLSIHQNIDGIKIKDILFDLNFKVIFNCYAYKITSFNLTILSVPNN